MVKVTDPAGAPPAAGPATTAETTRGRPATTGVETAGMVVVVAFARLNTPILLLSLSTYQMFPSGPAVTHATSGKNEGVSSSVIAPVRGSSRPILPEISSEK